MGENGPVAMNIGLGPGCMHTNAIQNGRADRPACRACSATSTSRAACAVNLSFSVMLDDKITLWDGAKDPGRADLFTFGGEEHPLYKSFGRSNDPHAVFQAIITGEPRPVKAFVAIANDPLLCYENTNLTYQAMTSPNLDFIAVKDFYMSPTAKLADLVLPSSDWAERCTLRRGDRRQPAAHVRPGRGASGRVLGRLEVLPGVGQAHRPRALAVERHQGNGAVAPEGVLRPRPHVGRVPGRGLPLHRAGRQEGRVHREEVREGHACAPTDSSGFPTPTGRIEFWCDALAQFGYDPLPDYTEPLESPISQPELAEEYPLIAVTGHRVYSFFHSAWTNIPAQRKLYPDPFVLIHPDDATKYGITDGEWVTITSPRGHIISKAEVSRETKKGVVCVPRPAWRDDCPELGLPGYGWDKANGNILVPSVPAEPGYGATAMRSSLCKIEAGRGDL